MQVLRNTASMERAAQSTTDPALRSLLSERIKLFHEYVETDLSEVVTFLIVEPDDALAAIGAELGFPILENRFDRSLYGQPNFTPCWEWILDHDEYFEIVFVLSPDGYGVIVFVRNDPGVDSDLLAMSAEYAGLPECPCA